MTAGAEDDRVGEVRRRGSEVGREQAGREVCSKRAVRAEMAGEKDHIVTRVQQLRAQCVAVPRGGDCGDVPFGVISASPVAPVPASS
jgi:hypothetical protein